ncbi:hypothetical protein SLS64_013191 [Diaporthe eres]
MANWPRPRRSRQPHRELNNFQQAVDERRRVDVGAHEPFVEELEDDDGEPGFYAAAGFDIPRSEVPTRTTPWVRTKSEFGAERTTSFALFEISTLVASSPAIQSASQMRETGRTTQEPFKSQQKQRDEHDKWN